jgi:NitT/TauT family transport system substrate-binding protein
MALGWTGVVTGLHMKLNFDWTAFDNERLPAAKRKINVGYIPVTCHLACPVTDYISKHSTGGSLFIPKMFQSFPEMKESLIANKLQAAFLVAPMAIALKAQGAPVRIVYLGHRYGSAVVVAKNGPIKTIADLRGRTIAIPSRFSDERLIVLKVMKEAGIPRESVKLVEMAPPDVAGALAASAIDGFSMGEPFPSQAEIGGFGRVLFFARDHWPDFMSCVLVVREDVIENRPDAVQTLVDGVARSGLWLEDESKDAHRNYAAEFVGKYYYSQPPALLRWALTKPNDRVTYNPLTPRKADFDMVSDLMVETGLLDRKLAFEDYTDVRFAEKATIQTSWKFEPGDTL